MSGTSAAAPFQFPTKDDPRLLAAVNTCAPLFIKYVKCSRRAMTAAQSSPEYTSLIADHDRLIAAKDKQSASRAKRRADNVLIMAMVRECGYVRSPLKSCLAEVSCADERTARDAYLASRPDLAMSAGQQAEAGGPVTDPRRAREFKAVAELEKGIEDCIRKYQFAMNVTWDKGTESFDLDKMSRVEIQVVKPGQL
ncbi:hypothetical protein AMAG_05098 [Allomyces macrogynus ATCC 38327]|uniref:Uncharacterized protein n=1 Tax=Allomyces macrogynus (strain ATCC 38327) TaxID=578462 RepID=A0A0L0S7G7_ALLM3|nr:hypothetical protein AMAG_05098 [Allomyces macrogynus ATCC 38327]|eukprot:KNE58289.1 hypothetical protein AMAG_05098 [Allomyces macrogynus ATCC 38327]